MTTLQQKISAMRNWCKAHPTWNADQLWKVINRRWPMLPDDDKEAIFQRAVK